MHRIQGSAGALLEEVCRALALGETLRPREALPRMPELPTSDMLLGQIKVGKPLERQLREATELMLRYVLHRKEAPSGEDLLGLTDRLRDAIGGTVKDLGLGSWRPSPEELADAFGEARGLCREIGLERLDTELTLGRHRDAGDVIVPRSMHPYTAHVWLLGRLFQRLGTLLYAHPLQGLERLGSAWWFGTHSAARFDRRDFTRTVREQEWSLIDRPSLTLETPVLDAGLDSDFNATLPTRQHRLATALRASMVSVFVVVERTGSSAVFEEIVRGRRIEVHEHGGDTEYEAGWIGFGRVCAFDGPLHLRSPGMVFVPEDPELIETLRAELRRGRFVLTAAVRVESLLSTLMGERNLPRTLAPAASRREAKDLLHALTEALDDLGLSEAVSGDEFDPELTRKALASGVESVTYRSYNVDASTSAWMQALMNHAKGAPFRRGGGKKRKKRGRRSR